jgi:bifunctional non-homologous end joining protein LigD
VESRKLASLHEIKLDGFRMAGRIERGQAKLLTRTGLDWSAKYPSLLTALAAVRADQSGRCVPF